ncbi:MAG: hypothetical protein KIT31_37700, partial [Deltaproteobacteria bacterium]|nr:hypothetical protein [Deltaproteobacteria bacterium]
MAHRSAAFVLLAGLLGCHRTPYAMQPAVSELGCVYDPATQQLRVCLEAGMLDTCATYGATCRGSAPGPRDLDVPAYRSSPYYVARVEEPLVEPVAPAEPVYAHEVFGYDDAEPPVYVAPIPTAPTVVGVPPVIAPPSTPPPGRTMPPPRGHGT